MKRAVLYIHGQGGNASEAEHYVPLFPECDVVGMEYQARNPWEAKEEFSAFYASIDRQYDSIILIANSIGAYFALSTPADPRIEHAFLISPIVNMERLIRDMMAWANVCESELMERKEITTNFGENLSWNYLCYAKDHPIQWSVPTDILYGDKDHLTSQATVFEFAERISAKLTIMPGGEHWFHTEKQMDFLDHWIGQSMNSFK